MTKHQMAQDVLSQIRTTIGNLPSQPFNKADLKLEQISDLLPLLAHYAGLDWETADDPNECETEKEADVRSWNESFGITQ